MSEERAPRTQIVGANDFNEMESGSTIDVCTNRIRLLSMSMRTLTSTARRICPIMATGEEYDHIYAFLSNHEYPAGFGKNEKRALRRTTIKKLTTVCPTRE